MEREKWELHLLPRRALQLDLGESKEGDHEDSHAGPVVTDFSDMQ
jgi:hypothetical protein